LVEHLICNQRVGGSNPSASSIKSRKINSAKLSKTLLVVTPGIRPDGYPEDDQKRRTSPTEAIMAGADYLVLGRPITEAVNPKRESEQIIAEMQRAFDALQQTSSAG
jgi:orotidine-5'-phosphate decarboxylase